MADVAALRRLLAEVQDDLAQMDELAARLLVALPAVQQEGALYLRAFADAPANSLS